jgi:hypothetical protein
MNGVSAPTSRVGIEAEGAGGLLIEPACEDARRSL